jgi:hypothetical protein
MNPSPLIELFPPVELDPREGTGQRAVEIDRWLAGDRTLGRRIDRHRSLDPAVGVSKLILADLQDERGRRLIGVRGAAGAGLIHVEDGPGHDAEVDDVMRRQKPQADVRLRVLIDRTDRHPQADQVLNDTVDGIAVLVEPAVDVLGRVNRECQRTGRDRQEADPLERFENRMETGQRPPRGPLPLAPRIRTPPTAHRPWPHHRHTSSCPATTSGGIGKTVGGNEPEISERIGNENEIEQTGDESQIKCVKPNAS